MNKSFNDAYKNTNSRKKLLKQVDTGNQNIKKEIESLKKIQIEIKL